MNSDCIEKFSTRQYHECQTEPTSFPTNTHVEVSTPNSIHLPFNRIFIEWNTDDCRNGESKDVPIRVTSTETHGNHSLPGNVESDPRSCLKRSQSFPRFMPTSHSSYSAEFPCSSDCENTVGITAFPWKIKQSFNNKPSHIKVVTRDSDCSNILETSMNNGLVLASPNRILDRMVPSLSKRKKRRVEKAKAEKAKLLEK